MWSLKSFCAAILNIPSIIQEQNSYPGITTLILSKFVDKICVAYENMDRILSKSKIVFTEICLRWIQFCKSRKQVGSSFTAILNYQNLILQYFQLVVA